MSDLQGPQQSTVASVQKAVEENDDCRAQRDALYTLTRVSTVFVRAMEALEGSIIIPTKLKEAFVNERNRKANFTDDEVCCLLEAMV